METFDIVANVGVGDWLLWGGLAALFFALYIGAYVWMRRPEFGEGKDHGREPSEPLGSTLEDRNGRPPPEPE